MSAEGRHAGTLQDTTGEGDEVLFCRTGISCSVLYRAVPVFHGTSGYYTVVYLGSNVNVGGKSA